MNHHTSLQQLTAILSMILCFVPPAITFAQAKLSEPSPYDLSICQADLSKSHHLYDRLFEDGWIVEGVSFDDFDYIYTLSYQLCGMSKNVPYELVLAMIALESGFDKNAESKSGAVGLMQVTPLYHYDRMLYFVEEGHDPYVDDFFDPRLNMACGIDYMDELLESTDGDTVYSLMCYNQGVVSANRTRDKGIVSEYAATIVSLSDRIRVYLSRES